MRAGLGPEKSSDEYPLDLRRPLPYLIHLDVPPVPRHGIVLHEPVPPVDLHRVVRRPLRRLRRVQLRHRGEHPDLICRFGPLVAVRRRRPIHDGASHLRLHGHVCELELDRLVLRDRLAEPPPLLGVSQRRVEARLRDPDRQRGDRDPPARQRVQELPVSPTPLTQQVGSGNRAIFEAQRVGVGGMPTQLSIRLEHVIARRPGRHHDRADLGPVLTRATGYRGDRHTRRDVGAAVGDELLRPVDHPLAVTRLRARLGRARVRPGLWLGQPERPQFPSRDEVRKPLLFLLASAEFVYGRRAEADRRLQRDAHARIGARDLLDRDAEGKEISARSPHFFRKRQTEKAKVPHLAHDVVAESMIPIELPRRRRDNLPREVATRVSNRLLFRSQCKIHCNNPCMTTQKRCTLPPASRTSTGPTSTRSAIRASTRKDTESSARWSSSTGLPTVRSRWIRWASSSTSEAGTSSSRAIRVTATPTG